MQRDALKVVEIKCLSGKYLVVFIYDPSAKRDHFYRECARQSHFRSACSELGSPVRKCDIVVALHYGTQQQNLRQLRKFKCFSVLCLNNLITLRYLGNTARDIRILNKRPRYISYSELGKNLYVLGIS